MYKPVLERDLEFLFGAFSQRPLRPDPIGSLSRWLRWEMAWSQVSSYVRAMSLDPDWIPAILRELPRFGRNIPAAYDEAVKLYFSMRRRLTERIRSGCCLICDEKASPDAPLAIYCDAHGEQFYAYVCASDALFQRFVSLLRQERVSVGIAHRQLLLELGSLPHCL